MPPPPSNTSQIKCSRKASCPKSSGKGIGTFRIVIEFQRIEIPSWTLKHLDLFYFQMTCGKSWHVRNFFHQFIFEHLNVSLYRLDIFTCNIWPLILKIIRVYGTARLWSEDPHWHDQNLFYQIISTNRNKYEVENINSNMIPIEIKIPVTSQKIDLIHFDVEIQSKSQVCTKFVFKSFKMLKTT